MQACELILDVVPVEEDEGRNVFDLIKGSSFMWFIQTDRAIDNVFILVVLAQLLELWLKFSAGRTPVGPKVYDYTRRFLFQLK